MNIIKLDSTPSTNTWLKENATDIESPVFVYCRLQSAGRGQRGNSWESEEGKNITGSVLFHPHSFKAANQFLISEAVALAIIEFLRQFDIQAAVKWPNDIYVGNKKICGILVENVVIGNEITRTIMGFGININQEKFLSDAPNPVSVKLINKNEYDYDIDGLVLELSVILEKYLDQLTDSGSLHNRFMENLWRNDRLFYPYFDKIKNEKLMAVIDNVAPDGLLTLRLDSGESRSYMFKEVEFLI